MPNRGIVSRLSPAARARLQVVCTRKTYGSGQLIHQRGDKRAGVDFIISGMVRLGAVGRSGFALGDVGTAAIDRSGGRNGDDFVAHGGVSVEAQKKVATF